MSCTSNSWVRASAVLASMMGARCGVDLGNFRAIEGPSQPTLRTLLRLPPHPEERAKRASRRMNHRLGAWGSPPILRDARLRRAPQDEVRRRKREVQGQGWVQGDMPLRTLSASQKMLAFASINIRWGPKT